MTQLAIALAEYQRLLHRMLESGPEEAQRLTRTDGARLFEGLEVSVIPAVIPLLSQGWFREYATWHTRVLTPGCGSSELAKLEAAIEALQKLLESLSGAFEGLSAKQASKLREPRSSENFRLAGARALPIVLTRGDKGFEPIASSELVATPDERLSAGEIHSQIQYFLNDIDQSLRMPMADPADYFGPSRAKRTAGGGAVRLEFLTDFSDNLKRGGSLIAKCVDIRLLGILDQLQDVAAMIHGALPRAKPRPWTALFEPARSKISELREALFSTSDAQTASAAAILVQMVVEIGKPADYGWLPAPFDPRNSANLFRYFLKSYTDAGFALRVESALSMHVQIIANRPEREKIILEAVEKRGLVVVREPRGVFWEGVEVTADWESLNGPWRVILSRAESRGLKNIGMKEVFADEIKGIGALSQLVFRLSKLLPDSLAELISCNKGESQYFIKLPSSAITVIR